MLRSVGESIGSWAASWFTKENEPVKEDKPLEQQDAKSVEEDTDAMLDRIDRMVAEMDASGTAMCQELERQKGKIASAEKGMQTIQDNHVKSESIISRWRLFSFGSREPDPLPPRSKHKAKTPDKVNDLAPQSEQETDAQPEELVKIDYAALGQDKVEARLEGLSRMLAGIKGKACDLNTGIVESHKDLKALIPKVETADDKNRELAAELKTYQKSP